MNKINYFDERELLVRREIETKTPKGTETKGTQVLPIKNICNSRWSLALKSCYYGALGANVWKFYAYYKLFNSVGRRA